MVRKAITMVPLLFTSITKARYHVFFESPAYAFLYNALVAETMLRK